MACDFAGRAKDSSADGVSNTDSDAKTCAKYAQQVSSRSIGEIWRRTDTNLP